MSYNRDLQELTPNIWRGMRDAKESIRLLIDMLASASFDKERIAAAARSFSSMVLWATSAPCSERPSTLSSPQISQIAVEIPPHLLETVAPKLLAKRSGDLERHHRRLPELLSGAWCGSCEALILQKHNPLYAISSAMQEYADRGVFRSFSRLPVRNGVTAFRLVWFHDRPFELIVDTRKKKILVPVLLPRVPENLYRDLKEFIRWHQSGRCFAASIRSPPKLFQVQWPMWL
jgi:hypothetical protein